METKRKNNFKLCLFCILLGLSAATVIWIFLKVMSEGMYYIWEIVPEYINVSWYPVIICTAGGLITGLFRKKYGDYPEELSVVMGKIKKYKNYEYRNMAVMIIGALLPLLMGSSIGPEAGMTGIIAGLCYWIGNNIKFAETDSKEYSELGAAVTLGILFHSPLFGIFAVEEDSDEVPSITKGNKIFFYGLAIAGSTAGYMILCRLFGNPMSGFPSFETFKMPETKDYMIIAVYFIVGAVLAFIYNISNKVTLLAGNKLPAILSETVSGLLLGIIGTFIPAVMFSGEEQMTVLMNSYTSYAPYMLLGISILKILLTNICINMGLKGGHFFPLIFAGVCAGYAVSMFTQTNLVLGAAVVTATLLGCIMKKPIAVTMLLFLCFPVKMFVWLFLASLAGSKLFKFIYK